MSKSHTTIQQKIAEKRANLEKLREFKELTDELTDQLENVGSNLETMTNGTTSVGLILATWQNVVQSIALASLKLAQESNTDGEDPLPEPLIRVGVSQSDDQKGDEEDEDEEVDDIEDEEM
ncbi:DAD2 DASH complex subunit DAD2 [Candida maltosa Xu316]|uniref:DASH complex subunit DAD2 n=1 Tax=Candida maltosa (strain Xu316) TaxID=1245528 RepID=M3JEW0_CANMX|nr:DASH complex subunit DAD2 [Candida maltosa Xu316]